MEWISETSSTHWQCHAEDSDGLERVLTRLACIPLGCLRVLRRRYHLLQRQRLRREAGVAGVLAFAGMLDQPRVTLVTQPKRSWDQQARGS